MCKLVTTEVYRRLLKYAYRYSFNREDSEDLLQEALLNLHRKQGADFIYIKTYIKQAMINKLVHNSAKKRSAVLIPLEDIIEIPSTFDIDEILTTKAMQLSVLNFLEDFPDLHPIQKNVLTNWLIGEPFKSYDNLTNHRRKVLSRFEKYILEK